MLGIPGIKAKSPVRPRGEDGPAEAQPIPRSGGWGHGTTVPEEVPTSLPPTSLPSGTTPENTEQHPGPANNSPKRSLLVPRTLIQPCCGGHSGTQVRKACFLQQNKKSSVRQDGGDIVPFWGRPLRPVEVLGRSGCSSPSPIRTCGSCSVGCGARCCVSAGAANIPWSRGPVPLASWEDPHSSGTA